MSDQRDAEALGLFKAAISIDEIRDGLGFRDVRQVEAAIRRALERALRGKDTALKSVELERIDTMYQAIYPAALAGKLEAVDRCLRLSEQRMRYSGELDRPRGGLLEAYEATIAALELRPEDGAVVTAGRVIARQIDDAVTYGAGVEVTKALYLIPHLMNTLRELGATPAARATVADAAPVGEQPAGISELDAMREKYLSAVT